MLSDADSSGSAAMQVMTIGATSIDEQLAQMNEAIARLTRTVEEKDLQIAALVNRLEAQDGDKPDPSTASASAGGGFGEAKMWEDESQRMDGEMDELLAVLGYKVRSSDMADVAQKLEQLEEFMGCAQEDGLSQLASDTVHYNPSDL
ncbi:hypothetical protein ACFX1S_014908 [Malus domestica]